MGKTMAGDSSTYVANAHDGHYRVTYQDIHRLIRASAAKIKDEFRPDIMIAIGGGGFFPARVMRTFLKTPDRRNIPIQAIGLSLYEDLGTGTSATQTPTTTLAYAVNELQKDIKLQTDAMPADQKRPETAFAVFTVHNKLKHKAGEIPSEVMYFSGQDIDDKWVDY